MAWRVPSEHGVRVTDRIADTIRFYQLLADVEERSGGMRYLAECTARTGWPRRGVYFFFEMGEVRSGSGDGKRVVRIGTHALNAGSGSTLWGRLSQHRGPSRGGGNHRGSIFRLLIGVALARREGTALPSSWGIGSDRGAASKRLKVDREAIKSSEVGLEASVSEYIGGMPFLWLDIGDEPGPTSERGMIERNAIGLLSAAVSSTPDPASAGWLGQFSDRPRVRRSGLWNNNHVDEVYSPSFLDALEEYVTQMRTACAAVSA